MEKILLWLLERIKRWTKPVTLPLIPGLFLDLTRSRADLVIENALLRQQLIVLNRQVKRPQLTNPDRFRLVFLSQDGRRSSLVYSHAVCLGSSC